MSTQESFIPVRPTGIKFPKWAYEADYRIVDASNVKEALAELVRSDVVAWDSEYENTYSGHVVASFQFSTRPFTGWLIPVGMDHIQNLPLDIVRRFIYAISKKPNPVQAAQAEMRSVRALWPGQEELLNITDDIQVIWYLRDPNESKDFKEGAPRRRGAPIPTGFSLTQMALKYLKLEIPDLSEYFKGGHHFRELDPETARIYGCSDTDVTLRLFQKGMDPALRDSFIYKLEMQLIEVLLDMEERGLKFDKSRLAEIEEDIREVVKDARLAAYTALKTDPDSVEIDSPTQLARHISNVLQWPIIGKRRKDGLGSTDKTVMARYAESGNQSIAEGAKAFMAYKKWKTLHNNFLTKLHEYVNPITGAIHCSFLATVVPTGRLACASPNLQQVPQRNERAPLRRAFRARSGYFFVEADHSQIELRVYTGETQEAYYFDSFTNGVDLHLKTAGIIYREQITDKKDPRRQMGKVMNFGPIYGMKPEGLAMRTDYTLQEAERILDDFFSNMPDAVQWTHEVHAKAKQMGGVHTHFGRWRPLPWLHSRVPHEVEFGERSAVNTIVQGTAADIMKIGLVRLHKALKKKDCPFEAYLVLTVHDSVMLEVADGTDLEAFREFLAQQLCIPIQGYPPLEIDCKYGRNWHDMEDFDSEDPAVPDPEPVTVQHKELVLPTLTSEQQRTLISLLNVPAGEVYVTFKRPDGSPFVADPIKMVGEAYKNVVMFLVTTARTNKAVAGDTIAPDVPKVSFA